ncbi:aldolase [Chloroflexota bacterium]
MILTQFQNIGSTLFSRGLVSSKSGNLSIRLGERLIITRRGSMLGSLEEDDLVETGIDRNDRSTPLASSELNVHRAIYRGTSARAIAHAHCPYTVVLSFIEKEIVPRDVEGAVVLHKVPVIKGPFKSGGKGMETLISEALKRSRIVVVRGHGIFAIGQLLEEACHLTMILEDSCRILHLLMTLGNVPAVKSSYK